MSAYMTLERVADLRESAKNLRESAARAERYHTTFEERQQALRLDMEADALEQHLYAPIAQHLPTANEKPLPD